MKIEVNGLQMNVEIAGDGPALLLLHGFTGSSENWTPFLESWTKDFKVIMPDLIGHGKSEAPIYPDRYEMDQAVEDIMALLDRLQIDKTHVLGYSMGGRLALTLATSFPERINTLLLESSSPGLANDEERRQRVEKDENIADSIMEKGVEDFVLKWENIPLFDTQKRLSEEIRRSVRQQRMVNSACGLANNLKGMGTGKQRPLWNELESLNIPVFLLVGELDRKFCNIAEKMLESLPDAKLIRFPDTGHAIHVEDPRFFGRIVKEALLECSNT
ncbi:2-succinyl-6-hydroxy-2,4-cyclohexadiene-1-carboxylate synthase [Pseudalkalibacillus caeni]|uniref:Putative 2-succinyl-6-hydroxy-2,4-cyclohexadiene-1-carboxylate synthase n=1 Tax=Exobacillus caeni TaxID=2574798 RepID=A0A5R9F9Q8_9BACL|nr:2-succinyl-6-hydroxy-2,4-cyclohexadiene-1-carboxylate synthase [Pseudalkalibacillus caeni]TLS39006.1 2-succinyl-6-hydroxy-2,4-cyclohexadiene-1-carboxylate synthase [Pseudalkalibacillus caeni]